MDEPFVIKTSTPTLPVRDGETSSFVWIIEPDKNPDRYYLKRTSKDKTLIFETHDGPRVLQISPNKTYKILFDHNGVQARAEVISKDDHSIVLQPSVAIMIVLIGIAIMAVATRVLKKISHESILKLSLIIPLLFWTSSIVGGLIHGDYNHIKMVVSDLGALGTRSELFMSITELVMACLVLVFFRSLWHFLKHSKLSIIPAIPLLFFATGLVGVAFFPLENEFHALAGNFSLPIMFAPILSLILWRKSKLPKKYVIFTSLSIIVSCGIFLRFVPSLNSSIEGLVQRSFYLGWSIWLVALYILIRKHPKN